MSPKDKQPRPYRIYHPTMHAMFGPTVKDGVITTDWGWISLANDQHGWRELCILTNQAVFVDVKKKFPEAELMWVE